MIGQSFTRVPINPRLEFGVPLKKVCEKGILHPGLRDLFLKAYLSASWDDYIGDDQFKESSKISYVSEALKAGTKGQGSLAERISLKSKLELGQWIIATQVAAGAPLWLLRHFLGCLPRPLLHGSDWRTLAVGCRAVSHSNGKNYDDILKKLKAALDDLPIESYSTLTALVLLIRDLSAVTRTNDSVSVTLDEEALQALSLYFTAAVISRPYRPGFYTMLDKEHKSLLLFLSERWLEVEELCRHAGISRYHSTWQSRYEFVSPDSEVEHIVWRAMTTAEDITDKIDIPESFARKLKDSRISYEKARPIDTAGELIVRKTEIPGDSVPITIHTPKGVYLIPPIDKCIRTSTNDDEVSKKMMKDSRETLADSARAEFEHCYIRLLEAPKIDGFECIHLRKVQAKDKSNSDPNIDLKKVISKRERGATVFTGIRQAFKPDGVPPKREAKDKVKVKIDGTQTFECEFSENGSAIEVEKLQERMDKVRVSSRTEEILENIVTRQRSKGNVLAIVNISKIGNEKKAVIPLTKSIALLIENVASNEDVVYFPAMQTKRFESLELLNKKVIDADQRIAPKKDACLSTAANDAKTLTNPFKDGNRNVDQRKNLNRTDFVLELKNNFKQGRRKPSDAKLSSKIVFANDSVDLDVAMTTGQRSSKVLQLQSLLDSTSTHESFRETSCVPITSANSI